MDHDHQQCKAVALSSHESLTYPAPNITDFTLADNKLEVSIPLDNGRGRRRPITDLGVLDALPMELLVDILSRIDLLSLTRLRSVNHRARQVVDSIPSYRAVLQYCPEALRGILAVDAGAYVSCIDLHQALSTAICSDCQDFGGFIYLPTCRRVCFLCFTENEKYLPLPAAEVQRVFGLKIARHSNLPRIRSLPGYYSPNKKLRRLRFLLYDRESVCKAAEELYGSTAAMNQHVAKAASLKMEAYEDRCFRWTRDASTPAPRQPSHMAALDSGSSNPRRFMAVVAAPWLNPSTKRVHRGFHCVGCKRQYRSRPLHWRRKYHTDSFINHIETCGPIKNGEHCC